MDRVKRGALANALVIVPAVFLLAACGAPADEPAATSAETGEIVAALSWPADEAHGGIPVSLHRSTHKYSHAIELAPDVVTIRGIVSGPDMDPVQADFDAGVEVVDVEDVPAGGARVLTVQGLDESGTVLYEGASAAVTVAAETAADAGAVPLAAVVAPPAPDGVTAAAGTQAITLAWAAVGLAESYNLYWATVPGVTPETGTPIPAVPNPYTHTALEIGGTYYYIVTAANQAGESEFSIEVSATALPPIPAAPEGVSAMGGDGQVTIDWDPVAGATSYNVYVDTEPGVTTASPLAGSTEGTEFIDTGLDNETSYFYVVTAVNAGGESPASGEVSATPQEAIPGVPQGVGATGGDGQVTIDWDPVDGATSYNVYFGTETGAATTLLASPETNTFTHTGRTNGTATFYLVTAISAGGEGAPSGETSATADIAAPTGLVATAGDGEVSLSWDAVSGASGYNVYADTASGVTKTSDLVGTPSGTSFTDSPLDNGTAYYYRVSTVGVGGEGSGLSGEVYATTAVAAPDGLTVGAGLKRLDFSWDASSGATYYQLQEDPDGSGTFTQVGADITAPTTSASLAVPVHLLEWATSQYRVRACIETACTPSAPIGVASAMLNTIGYFKASNTGGSDQFGYSVALSGDGNTLAVGAYAEDSSTTGINSTPNESGSGAGAVYVFVRNGSGWNQQAYVKASNTGANDAFGVTVALSGDGNTLAVGADAEDSSTTGINSTPNESASGAGAAYVFTRSGSTWSQQAYVKASNTGGGDFFGYSVALSGDGNTLAVGAQGEDSSTSGINSTPNESALNAGAAYVFTRSGTTWSQQAYVKPSNNGVGDDFGFSVALNGDGNTLAVGALFEGSSTTGINSTPNEGASASGAAYVFTRSGTTWSQQAYVKASNTGAADLFGASTALSQDGNTLAVGAYGEDSSTTGINSTPDESGGDSGATYVFIRSGSTWLEQAYVKASNTGISDTFGISVTLSADGNTLAVGADTEAGSASGVNGSSNDGAGYSGAAYVFTRSGGTWSQKAYLKATNTESQDYFGYSVSLSGDGGTLAVGAYQEDSSTTGVDSTSNESAQDSGAVYLY